MKFGFIQEKLSGDIAKILMINTLIRTNQWHVFIRLSDIFFLFCELDGKQKKLLGEMYK